MNYDLEHIINAFSNLIKQIFTKDLLMGLNTQVISMLRGIWPLCLHSINSLLLVIHKLSLFDFAQLSSYIGQERIFSAIGLILTALLTNFVEFTGVLYWELYNMLCIVLSNIIDIIVRQLDSKYGIYNAPIHIKKIRSTIQFCGNWLYEFTTGFLALYSFFNIFNIFNILFKLIKISLLIFIIFLLIYWYLIYIKQITF